MLRSRSVAVLAPAVLLCFALSACPGGKKAPEKAPDAKASSHDHTAATPPPASTPVAAAAPSPSPSPAASPEPAPSPAPKETPKEAPATPKATPSPKPAEPPKTKEAAKPKETAKTADAATAPKPPAEAAPKEAPATPAPAAGGGTISGKITVAGGETNFSGAVVYLPGVHRKGSAARAKAQMTSHNKTFEPHVIAVSAGDTVDFPNLDKIHHNVFSLSEANKFDLGLYKNGASRSQVFAKACVCRVYCNIHAQMSGIVVVADGDAYAVTGPDGSYKIDGLPPGKHTVIAWHEKGGEQQAEVEIAEGKALTKDFTLDASGFKEAPHTNKYGKPYGKDDDARY